MKETHSNFAFGGWGSSWNTSSGINGENTGITDITDTTKNTSVEEPGFWSLGLGSKSKKKTASPDLDFGGFSASNEAQEEPAALEDTKGEGNDDWPETLPLAGKKDKKSKKKGAHGFEDKLKDFEPIATGDSKPEPEAVGEDTWGDTAWGAPVTKGTKKKGKKAEAVPKTSEISPISPHAIAAPIAPTEEEGPALGSKKEKKKKHKASSGEVEDFKELAIEEALEPEVGAETNWGFSAKKEKKDKNGIIEETVSHEETAVTEELAAEEINWGFGTKKDPKKTKKSTWGDEPYGADPASAIVPDLTIVETSWGTGAKKGPKKSKKFAWDEEGEAPQVVAAPESEQQADLLVGFGSKEGSKKKSKKGASDESDKAANSLFAFEGEPEPEPEPEPDHLWGSGIKKDSKKKAKKGVSEESDKVANPFLAFEDEPEPKIEPSWGLETAKKDNKKKSKKGVVEKPDEENPMVSPLAKPESEPGYDWDFGNSNAKTKKGALKEPGHAEDPMLFSGYKPELQTNFSWDTETNKDNKMKSKKGAFEGFDNGEDTVPQVFPNAELDVATGWGTTGAKTSKKKGKMGVAEETKQADDLSPIDVPEQTSAVEEMAGTWGMPAKKDKKSKKGHSEVKETPMRAAETVSIIDPPNGFANDSWPDWEGDKKKEKKGRKGSAADAKKEEPSSMQFSPPLQDSEPPASSFDSWGGAKKEKEKKGKKGKAVGSGPEPEPEPVTNMTFDTLADDAYTDGNDWGGWGLSAKDKTKKEKDIEKLPEWEQANDHHEMYEQAEKEKVDKEEEKEKVKPGKKGKSTNSAFSKTKDLMANSTPDPIPTIEPGNWGTWDGPKKDKKPVGRKDMFQGAPPPAPTPPAQGLTPEPTPSPIPGLDDIGEADWGSFAPMKSKGKKDAKKPTKAEEPKSDKKATKDKAGEPPAEPTKNKTKNDAKKGAAKEETPAKVARGFWGSMGMSATPKSKAIEEEEVDDDEEESAYKDEGNYDEDIEGEETNDLIDFEMGGDSITDLIDAPVMPGSKTKADGKLGKVSSKESDKSNKVSDKKKKKGNNNNNFMTEVPEVAVPEFNETYERYETNETNVTSGTPHKDDAWSFWGNTTKKPSGKKTEQADEPKKEITKQSWTNPIASLNLNQFSNQPEPSFFDDQPEPPKSTKLPKTAINMPTTKPSAKTTVAQRVKALEKERLEKEKQKALVPISDPDPDPLTDQFEPLTKFDSPPKKLSPVAKSKVTPPAKGAASKKKVPFPPSFEEIVEEKHASQDSVPGSFPAEGADDDITDVIPPPPVAKKTNKKTPKPKKEPKMNLMDFDDMPITSPPVPDLPEVPDGLDVPEAPPTPPPEPVAAKPAKKERARVRDEGISSWGFWGASPRKPVKKEAKAKDDGDVPTTAAKERAPVPGLVRSKSTKTAKEKETEKVSAKSSGSDKDRKAESRPAKSRGSSFGGFFGGPPPPRTRPLRRQSVATSKNTSRRQSVDAEAIGLPSPPAEVVPEMNSKAAKLMGTSGGKLARKESTRGPPKTSGIQSRRAKTDPTENANRRHLVVPDPYPIDDDDMVMVGGLDYPIVSDPSPKSKGVRKDKTTDSKAKKEVKSIPPSQPGFTRSKRSPSKKQVSDEWGKADVFPNLEQVKPAPEPADDIVMVEAGPSSDGAELPSLQEALAFAEPPSAPAPQRPSTSARKSDNKIMGLFGLRKTRRAPETYERPRSKAIVDDDVNLRRKRTVGGGNDATKRVRRDDRKVRRSERPDIDADGFVTDAPLERDATEYVEAKNDERRSKHASRSRPATEYRESRARDEEDQRAKLRESDQAQDDIRRTKIKESRDRRTKREEEEAAIRKEEKRAKKAAREERATKDEPLSRDLDPSSAFEGHSKHRDRDARDRDLPPETSSRPRKSGHRRSHIDTPKSPDATERRPRRDERRSSRRTPGEKSSSHRKATAAPVDDYFDPRNGAAGDIPDPVPDPAPLDPAPHESTAPDPVPLDPGPLDPQEPYMHSGANEHTSSWVKSQISEPPPPPPLEPSVLDPAPVLGGAGDESTVDEEARRALHRKSKRQSRYASGGDGGDGGGERRRRRESRRETVRSSEGSAEQERERTYARRKSDYGGGVPLRGYGTGGGGLGGKRESWFQKIKGLADAR